MRLEVPAETPVLTREPVNRFMLRTIIIGGVMLVGVVLVFVACDFSGGNSVGVNKRAIQAENQFACGFLIG